MNGGSLLRRLSSGPARVCGLVAGGLGLVVTLTAAVPPAGPQHGAAPPRKGPTAFLNLLTSVSAVSASDAWAVGNDPGLALRWNGTRWVRISVPHPSVLNGVSTLSASDAWAVGSSTSGNTAKTLVLHWNGTSWAQVASPNINGNGALSGVAALSPTDAWAVGNYTAGNDIKTLVLHWNGTAWVRS